MPDCCECCVLSGRGLCDELITRPEESYRLWCVVLCNLETSWMRRPWNTGRCCALPPKKVVVVVVVVVVNSIIVITIVLPRNSYTPIALTRCISPYIPLKFMRTSCLRRGFINWRPKKKVSDSALHFWNGRLYWHTDTTHNAGVGGSDHGESDTTAVRHLMIKIWLREGGGIRDPHTIA
jgi:hypothetical protein